MGTFSDPIIGDDGELIRDQIRSSDYVPGTSGWIIERTGRAEFQEVTMRGAIVADSLRLESSGPVDFFLGVGSALRVWPSGGLAPNWSVGPDGGQVVSAPILREPAWHAASLSVAWSNFGGAAQTTQYRLMPDGSVWLDGAVKSSATLGPGPSTLITLPVGYRPASTRIFGATGPGVPAGATLEVLPSGVVQLSNYGASATVALLGLTHVRFPII
jgi:hypothetical protein